MSKVSASDDGVHNVEMTVLGCLDAEQFTVGDDISSCSESEASTDESFGQGEGSLVSSEESYKHQLLIMDKPALSKNLIDLTRISRGVDQIKALIKDGADVNFVGGALDQTCLFAAISNVNPEVLDCLLGIEGINVNHQDYLGLTPLHVAVRWRPVTTTQALLKHPSLDLNLVMKGGLGYSALHNASRYNILESVEALVADPRVKINLTDPWGNSALMMASENISSSYAEASKIVKVIVGHGGSLFQQNKIGECAYDILVGKGYKELAEELKAEVVIYESMKIKQWIQINSSNADNADNSIFQSPVSFEVPKNPVFFKNPNFNDSELGGSVSYWVLDRDELAQINRMQILNLPSTNLPLDRYIAIIHPELNNGGFARLVAGADEISSKDLDATRMIMSCCNQNFLDTYAQIPVASTTIPETWVERCLPRWFPFWRP